MARKIGSLTETNGANTIRWPGAYAFALDRKCERDAMKAAPCYLTLDDDDEVLAQWQRDIDAHKAALIAERDGQPLSVHSHMLPPKLPPPFDRWPPGGSRGTFVVRPDDLITFNPREIRNVISLQSHDR
jgi:hypothetical protein